MGTDEEKEQQRRPEDLEEQVRNLLPPEKMAELFDQKCKDGQQPWEAFNSIVAKHFVAGAKKARLAF